MLLVLGLFSILLIVHVLIFFVLHFFLFVVLLGLTGLAHHLVVLPRPFKLALQSLGRFFLLLLLVDDMVFVIIYYFALVVVLPSRHNQLLRALHWPEVIVLVCLLIEENV